MAAVSGIGDLWVAGETTSSDGDSRGSDQLEFCVTTSDDDRRGDLWEGTT
jgi:hypothetical protein